MEFLLLLFHALTAFSYSDKESRTPTALHIIHSVILPPLHRSNDQLLARRFTVQAAQCFRNHRHNPLALSLVLW